jgi:protein-tyrosine phosphatase
MIDLHCHILPGIDDGAQDPEEALEMSRMAVDEGFSGIVATPHYGSGKFLSDINAVNRLVVELNQELEARNIKLTIFRGMEVRLTADVLGSLSTGKILSINQGPYVLMELPIALVPAGFENFVRMVIESGRKLVLAHPEKNLEIQRHPENIYNLLTAFKPGDLLMQITADSITGDAGLSALSTAKYLLENDLAHILATDAHSAVERPPRISNALDLVSSILGNERADKMVKEWPHDIVAGREVNFDPPKKRPEKRKSFWGLFRR